MRNKFCEEFSDREIGTITQEEIIFRTRDPRNRLILELMARGGMRISEVLDIKPGDIEDRKILITNLFDTQSENFLHFDSSEASSFPI